VGTLSRSKVEIRLDWYSKKKRSKMFQAKTPLSLFSPLSLYFLVKININRNPHIRNHIINPLRFFGLHAGHLIVDFPQTVTLALPARRNRRTLRAPPLDITSAEEL